MTDNKNQTPEKKETPFFRSYEDRKIMDLQEGFAATNQLADLQMARPETEPPTVCDDGETPLTDDLFQPAEYDAANAERIGYSNYSYWGSTLRVFLKSKVSVGILIFLVLILASTTLGKTAWSRLPDRAQKVLTPVLMALGLVVCTAYLVDGSYNPFLYFRF